MVWDNIPYIVNFYKAAGLFEHLVEFVKILNIRLWLEHLGEQ